MFCIKKLEKWREVFQSKFCAARNCLCLSRAVNCESDTLLQIEGKRGQTAIHCRRTRIKRFQPCFVGERKRKDSKTDDCKF